MTLLEGIELPGDLQWIDEYDWTPLAQEITPSLNGALIIEQDALQAGRPITLASDTERAVAWITRATVEALRAIETSSTPMSLTLEDGRVFSVRWRTADGPPIQARPVLPIAPQISTDFYFITLRLMQV